MTPQEVMLVQMTVGLWGALVGTAVMGAGFARTDGMITLAGMLSIFAGTVVLAGAIIALAAKP